MEAHFISTLSNLALGLLDFGSNVITWVTSTITIGGNTYSYMELMFGVGVTVILGAILVKWVIDFIP